MSEDRLDSNRRDHVVATLRGAVSAVPLAGGSIAEAISAVVREQRIDRIVAYIRELAMRLDEIDRQINGDNPLTVDLLEDTVIQSSRALSEDRNRYLANVMAESTDVSPEQYEFNKKLIQILSELTDLDIEVLKGHADLKSLASLQRTSRIVRSLTAAERRSLDADEKFEREASRIAFDVHVAALERLGLLHAERERPMASIHMVEHGGPLPEVVDHLDPETGLPRITGYRVTTLGRLLLTRLFGTYFD